MTLGVALVLETIQILLATSDRLSASSIVALFLVLIAEYRVFEDRVNERTSSFDGHLGILNYFIGVRVGTIEGNKP